MIYAFYIYFKLYILHARKTNSILVWPNVHPCIALNPLARWRADDVPTTLCRAFSYPWFLRNFIATAPCKSKSISESDRILLMKPVGAPFREVFLNFNMGKPANRHSKFSRVKVPSTIVIIFCSSR